MIVKMISRNQLILPEAVMSVIEGNKYLDVTVEDGRIVLTPVRADPADAVRDKLARLGITEADIADAVAWARATE